jgi:hypothetical protein
MKDFAVKKLQIENIVSLIVRKSDDNLVHIEAPKSVKLDQNGETLVVKGDGSSGNTTIISGSNVIIGSGISGSNSIIGSRGNTTIISGGKKSGRGNLTIISGGKKVEMRGDNVYIDGKLVDGNEKSSSEEKEELQEVVVHIPDNLMCSIAKCEQVNLEENFIFSSFTLQSSGCGEVKAKKIQASNVILNLSGSSDATMQEIHASSLVATTAGSSDLKVCSGKIITATLNSSGSSDLKIRACLENVVASASGASDCRFSKPTNPPTVSETGSADCRMI